MTVLFWAIGFFVWYLIGLVTGLLVLNMLNRCDIEDDYLAWVVMSSSGPIVWLLIIVIDILERRAK
jgi:hypothetical protein